VARVSNLATCASNALTGVALGMSARIGPFDWRLAAAMAVAIMLLYSAGMILNDLLDRSVDAVERPNRPIPSGRVGPRSALLVVATLMLGAMAILAWLSAPAAFAGACLIGAIIAYDALHLKSTATVPLMGLTRALVYVVGAAAVGWPFDVRLVTIFAVALLLYTVVISTIARHEMSASPKARISRWAILVLLAIPLLPLLVVRPATWTWSAIAGAALAIVLLGSGLDLVARPPRIRHAVGRWIAAMCLLDAFFLTLLDRPVAALVAGGWFVVTVAAHRRIAGS
jgi:4-hydroxybenzoate polyprenyltransferase